MFLNSLLSILTPFKNLVTNTQCTPTFSNPDQKVHGVFHFYIAVICKKIQNPLKKTSVIRLQKFAIVNMAENYHQPTSFSKENMFFEDYFIGSQMSDVFFNWV